MWVYVTPPVECSGWSDCTHASPAIPLHLHSCACFDYYMCVHARVLRGCSGQLWPRNVGQTKKPSKLRLRISFPGTLRCSSSLHLTRNMQACLACVTHDAFLRPAACSLALHPSPHLQGSQAMRLQCSLGSYFGMQSGFPLVRQPAG